MAKPIPDKIKTYIEEKQYMLSYTAIQRSELDGLDDRDIQEVFEYGYLWKKEKDEKKEAADGYKYIILGPGIHFPSIYTVGKIIQEENTFYYFIEFHKGDC